MAGMGLDTVVLRFVKVGKGFLYWNPNKQAYVKISQGQANLITRLLTGNVIEVKPRKRKAKEVAPTEAGQ